MKNEPYDPELVWNIEGPDRKRKEAIERKQVHDDLRSVNQQAQRTFYKRKDDERVLDKQLGQ